MDREVGGIDRDERVAIACKADKRAFCLSGYGVDCDIEGTRNDMATLMIGVVAGDFGASWCMHLKQLGSLFWLAERFVEDFVRPHLSFRHL